MNQKVNILLILIVIIGGLFRLYKLNSYPPSLNWDEISHSYTAYSLSETGKDQWNQSWPIFNFRGYGDYPTTLNVYLTLPLVKFFGLNDWTTRLPTALLGWTAVPLSFFLAQLLFKNTTISLLTALFMALSPWSLFPSRAVFQSTVAQSFLIFGLTLILQSFKRSRLIIPGFLLLAISAYAYHNTRIIVPILLFGTLIIFRKQFINSFKSNLVPLFTAGTVFLLLIIPQLINLAQPESRARSQWVYILNDAAINKIETDRNSSTLSPQLARLAHNRVTYMFTGVTNNFLNFLNPRLLFFEGTAHHQFNLPNHGILFSVWLPFFYLGIIYLLRNIKKPSFQFIIFWFVIGLIPSVITSGDFQIIRAMSILPLPHILVALGIYWCSRRFPKNKTTYFYGLIILLTLIQFGIFWSRYTTSYPRDYSSAWQYGYSGVIDSLKIYYPDYSNIYFTKKYGEPHQFILYHWPWSPSAYQTDPSLIWDYHAYWYWVDAFDKFRFVNDWEILNTPIPDNTLLVTSPGNYPSQNAKLIQTVNFLNGQPAFDLVSYESEN